MIFESLTFGRMTKKQDSTLIKFSNIFRFSVVIPCPKRARSRSHPSTVLSER